MFDYIDGGAEDEVTLANNCAAFSELTFRPRQCVPVPKCDLRTTVLGTEFALPFLLAPVGFCRMFYPMGEAHAARAANAAGTAYILSTFSGTRIEDVRAATAGPLWYQLYVPGGRAVAKPRSPERRRLATRRSWSPSIRRSPGCASATSAAAFARS